MNFYEKTLRKVKKVNFEIFKGKKKQKPHRFRGVKVKNEIKMKPIVSDG